MKNMVKPVTLKIPMGIGVTKSLVSSKKVVCNHWDETSKKWSNSGCKNKGSGFYTYNTKDEVTSITCECTHLSEFGISLTDADDGSSSGWKTSTWIILGLLLITFAAVAILCAIKLTQKKPEEEKPRAKDYKVSSSDSDQLEQAKPDAGKIVFVKNAESDKNSENLNESQINGDDFTDIKKIMEYQFKAPKGDDVPDMGTPR